MLHTSNCFYRDKDVRSIDLAFLKIDFSGSDFKSEKNGAVSCEADKNTDSQRKH